jgi:peptidylprolyl isomerase
MNILRKSLFILSFFYIIISCSSNPEKKYSYILIKTTLGNIKLRLYDETPGHRDNFIKLVKLHVYDGVRFHRVIKDFMIQTGDPESKSGFSKSQDDTLCTYTIPAEINPLLFHKKGAIAAAREGNEFNPEMKSSGTQFYIVQGIKYSDETLVQAEERIKNNRKQARFIRILKQISDSNNISDKKLSEAEIQERASLQLFQQMSVEPDYKIPENERSVYKNIGGVPRLDGTYTVFGEVVEGLDVVDKIAEAKTNEKDKPLTDLLIIRATVVRK